MERKRLALPVVQTSLLATSFAVSAPHSGETPVPADGIVAKVSRVQATALVDHGPIEGLLASERTGFTAQDGPSMPRGRTWQATPVRRGVTGLLR
jgi:hypothetical protein